MGSITSYMEPIKEKLNIFKEKFDLKKKSTVIPLILTIIFVGIVLVDKFFMHNHLLDIVFKFDFVMLGLFYILVTFIVGFSVMKALVHISAGLSLMIFLAQSYCDVPTHTASGDGALKFLLVISLIYLIFDFFEIFWKGISNYTDTFKTIKKEYFWKVLLVIFCLTIIFTFLWSIYQVMSPIILDLCIYK